MRANQIRVRLEPSIFNILQNLTIESNGGKLKTRYFCTEKIKLFFLISNLFSGLNVVASLSNIENDLNELFGIASYPVKCVCAVFEGRGRICRYLPILFTFESN